MNLSKLALARIEKELTQAQVADYVDVDVGTVCRWEKGSRQPLPRHIVKLSKLFGLSAQDLGLSLSKREEAEGATRSSTSHSFAYFIERDLKFRLDYLVQDWLRAPRKGGFSCVTLQSRLSQEIEKAPLHERSAQRRKAAKVSRLDALRRLALFPLFILSKYAPGSDSPEWTPQEILPHYAAGLTACTYLCRERGEERELAAHILSTSIPALRQMACQAPVHREEASRLATQGMILQAKLS